VGNAGVWLRADSMESLKLSSAATDRFVRSEHQQPRPTIRCSPRPGTQRRCRLAASSALHRVSHRTDVGGKMLRPYPQFGTIPTEWAALGSSWYDSLQTKLTKRVSHGLDITMAFTWSKELQLGATSGTAGAPAVNDILNRNQNSTSRRPPSHMSLPPDTPTACRSAECRTACCANALRDWTLSGMLRFASGLPILAPQRPTT